LGAGRWLRRSPEGELGFGGGGLVFTKEPNEDSSAPRETGGQQREERKREKRKKKKQKKQKK
jgi:hypothetical protein